MAIAVFMHVLGFSKINTQQVVRMWLEIRPPSYYRKESRIVEEMLWINITSNLIRNQADLKWK